MSEMSVMDKFGDTKLIWNSGNADEVNAASELFSTLKKKGYMAYKTVGAQGDKGEVLHSFDRYAERIILSPQMKGG